MVGDSVILNTQLSRISLPNLSVKEIQELCECCLTENGALPWWKYSSVCWKLFYLSSVIMHYTESSLKHWNNVRKTEPMNIHRAFIHGHLILAVQF